MSKTVSQKQKEAFETLKNKFNYKNVNSAPKIEKIVVSTGVGSTIDKAKLKLVPEKLALITGQKPLEIKAKKSIAQFKVREGDLSAYKVTLRGEKAYGFLDKIIDIALPRTRDFRGLSPESVDEMGNYTFGVKENTIFPETTDEELRNVFGMSITIVVSNTNSKEETISFLELVGMPFKK